MIYEDLLREPAQYAQRIFDYLGLPPECLLASDFTPVHTSEGVRPPCRPMWRKLAIGARDRAVVFHLERTRRILRWFRVSKLVGRVLERSGPALPPLAPELKARLREQFKGEVEGVERIIGRDLSIWKTPRIERAMP